MTGFLALWLVCGIYAAITLMVAGNLDFPKLAFCILGGPIIIIAALKEAANTIAQENNDG